jgi:phosphoglycerate dehydrogenase-like enzyme
VGIVVFTKPSMASALATELARAGIEDAQFCSADDVSAHVAGAEIVVIQQSLYDPGIAAAVESNAKLRLVHLTTSGHERLDGYRFPAQTRLAGSSQVLGPYVAEHAIGILMLLMLREATVGKCVRMRGRTATIVGTGAVGTEVARRLERFGVRRIGISRSGVPKAHFDAVWSTDRLHDALGISSILILAAPETQQTTGLIDGRSLAAMQPHGYLVNVARGALVRTPDLVNALADGRLAGAGLDVSDPFPLPASHALRQMQNVIVTPHCGGAGAEADVASHVVRNIGRYQAGLELQNVIALTVDLKTNLPRLG